jgi:LacI family transcriptional regulator
MATYKDLQARTGLSLATISKYYNGGNVLDENRQAIEAAARELGYRVNGFARSLRTNKSRTVGVLLPKLDNEFHLTVIAGVEAALREHGISVLVCASRGTPGEAVEFLLGRMVDGIIAVPTAPDAEALQAAAARGMPLVLIDRLLDGLASDAVVLDNELAARQAVQHLVEAGHTRIAALVGDQTAWTMRKRRDGFLAAMNGAGLEVPPAYAVPGLLTVPSGRSGMSQLLEESPPPSAVICLNYELTVGALIAINERGLSVPEDLSFVGFDSMELAQVTKPRLSMITQPTAHIAAQAARLIQSRLSGGAAPQMHSIVTLASELVQGGSVGSPPSADDVQTRQSTIHTWSRTAGPRTSARGRWER